MKRINREGAKSAKSARGTADKNKGGFFKKRLFLFFAAFAPLRFKWVFYGCFSD